MFDLLLARLNQGHRTMAYPNGPPPPLPEHFRGRPVIDAGKCPDGCRVCVEACPTQAIIITDRARIDLGRCLFCSDCQEACPQDAIRYARDYRLSVRQREQLVVDPEDLGKVIGRSGRVAHALRTVVRATAEGRVSVDILDSDEAADGPEDEVQSTDAAE